MLNFDDERKKSFWRAWHYHKHEFLVFVVAAVSYLLFVKNSEHGMAKSIIFYMSTVFPVVVVVRFLRSGFTGKLDEANSSKKKKSKK